MKIAFAVAALLAGVPSVCLASESDMRLPVDAFLCATAAQAEQFADIIAAGEIDEMAKDRVGRAAGAEVCGRFTGVATIESEHVMLKDGIAYKLTAYRFDGDHRLAWMAERTFAPPSSAENDI